MKLLWVDLETTGLDEKDGGILEIAAIATDGIHDLGTFHAIVSQPPAVLDKMVLDVRAMHTKNDLLAEMQRNAEPWPTVARKFWAWVCTYWQVGDVAPRLAGNSVHFDKTWLEYHMLAAEIQPQFYHRVLDVSTLRDVLKDIGLAVDSATPTTHRAMDDLRRARSQYELVRRVLNVGASVAALNASFRP